MEITVRYVPTQQAVVDGQVFAVGNKPALCFRGKTEAYCILNGDEGIESRSLELRIHDSSRPVLYQGEEYPISKYLARIENLNKPHTPEVDQLLRLIKEPPEDFPDPTQVSVQTTTTSKPKKTAVAAPGPSIIASLATQFKTAPTKVRRFLRSKGMSAPYEDEKKIRAAMKEFGKEEPKKKGKK